MKNYSRITKPGWMYPRIAWDIEPMFYAKNEHLGEWEILLDQYLNLKRLTSLFSVLLKYYQRNIYWNATERPKPGTETW